MMHKLIIPSRAVYRKHLQNYSQYSSSSSWANWYADVAKYKGLRTAKILKKFKSSKAHLLDLGCGIGLTLSIVAQAFPKSVGCDIDPKALMAAREILKEIGLKIPLITYKGRTLPFKDSSFDIVTSIEVIEHVANPRLMLREIKRVLKPDGILLITTANKWWPSEPHYKLPFLSYLPVKIADLYVKLSGRGKNYQGIKLPSYGDFKKSVGKFFNVKDITLFTIENGHEFFLDKERGFKVVILGKFLKWLKRLEAFPILSFLPSVINWLLVRISLGWLLIGRPKSKENCN